MNKKKKWKSILRKIALVVLSCVFIGSLSYLIFYFYSNYKNEKKADELKDMIKTTEESDSDNTSLATNTDAEELIRYVDIDGVLVQEKFEELYRENSDFIGWITIEDTEIDYPVMQSMDNEEYYLHRDFDKKYSVPGTLFADTQSDIRKPSDNIIIYGHHMQTGKMFQNITKYEKESFYKEHKYITFDTIEKNGTYEVISAFKTKIYSLDYDGFMYYTFFEASNEEEFNEYIKNCKALCEYDIPTTAEYGDELITLSTCNYHASNGRFVIVAKKIK